MAAHSELRPAPNRGAFRLAAALRPNRKFSRRYWKNDSRNYGAGTPKG